MTPTPPLLAGLGRLLTALVLLATVAFEARTAHGFERTEQRAPCDHHDPLRRPFFGDLHVHTAYSFDAWAQGTRNMPRDAYRFARGDALGIQPYGPDGKPIRTVRLRRPLDFAMVSDHAEMLGETQLCQTPGTAAYDSFTCTLMRRWPALGYMVVNSQWVRSGARAVNICGESGTACREAALSPWKATQDAAEEYYDRSSRCGFTTFVGFEWSGSRTGMVHRNVVFRNQSVLEAPPNAIDDGNDETRLWEALQSDCIEAGTGCDAFAIPHNSNVSAGSMFWTVAPDGTPLDAALARRRRDIEPLIEITQHKADSECRNDGIDPLCDFETVDFAVVAGHASAALYRDPVPPNVYVREALLDGLDQRLRLGVNPYKLGIIGSTDTHLGTPGMVDEDAFVGHAAGKITARLQIPALPDHPAWNPGGLAVVWAEENSRDALFEAMRRREVYGTSGPRMIVRLFGGWQYEQSMCGATDFAARGYAGGVPMGGDLAEAPVGASAPVFAVSALRDPGTAELPGTQLQRIQIVKGWIENGQQRVRVFDVAGELRDDQRVDLETCRPQGAGADTLCAVWTDPEFDPSIPAFYYARVVENPSCRWTRHACLAAEVDCDGWLPVRGPLAACCDPEVPKTIQERAWTSPIWYTPARMRSAG
ncbi:MAG: DUF3604 domain-containing protein [Candidatus Binatia bacterium]